MTNSGYSLVLFKVLGLSSHFGAQPMDYVRQIRGQVTVLPPCPWLGLVDCSILPDTGRPLRIRWQDDEK
jgi:hypothetical protein